MPPGHDLILLPFNVLFQAGEIPPFKKSRNLSSRIRNRKLLILFRIINKRVGKTLPIAVNQTVDEMPCHIVKLCPYLFFAFQAVGVINIDGNMFPLIEQLLLDRIHEYPHIVIPKSQKKINAVRMVFHPVSDIADLEDFPRDGTDTGPDLRSGSGVSVSLGGEVVDQEPGLLGKILVFIKSIYDFFIVLCIISNNP